MINANDGVERGTTLAPNSARLEFHLGVRRLGRSRLDGEANGRRRWLGVAGRLQSAYRIAVGQSPTVCALQV